MKIILTCHQYFPKYRSGTEVLTRSLALELCARGHQVSIFTGHPAETALPESECLTRDEVDGIAVFRYHHRLFEAGEHKNRTEMEYNDRLAAAHCKEVLATVQPDVLLYVHLSRLSASIIECSAQAGIPGVLITTDFWTACPTSQLVYFNGSLCKGPSALSGNCLKHIFFNNQAPKKVSLKHRLLGYCPAIGFGFASWLMDRYSWKAKAWYHKHVVALRNRTAFIGHQLNSINRILVPTKVMYETLSRAYPTIKDRLLMSPYGIDTGSITKRLVQPLGNKLRIGFIGTIAPHKGPHVIIDAIRHLDPEFRDRIDTKIYGSHTDFPLYFEQLITSCRESNLQDTIEFPGTFPNSEISMILGEIDALIVPSTWYENTPLVIYSAFAAGVPVICSHLGGMTEVVLNNINGLHFTSANGASLAKVLHRLLHEPRLISTLSSQVKTHRSIQTYTDDVLKALRDAVVDGSNQQAPYDRRMPEGKVHEDTIVLTRAQHDAIVSEMTIRDQKLADADNTIRALMKRVTDLEHQSGA